MINLITYITEKLHIDKNMGINETDDIKEISSIINEYFQKKLNFTTEEFTYMFQDDEGNTTKDEEKLGIIFIYSDYFEDKDIDKISKYLENSINKIKPIKKTEVFATSIYIYFK